MTHTNTHMKTLQRKEQASLLFLSLLFLSLLFLSLLFSSCLFSSVLFLSLQFSSVLFSSFLFLSLLFSPAGNSFHWLPSGRVGIPSKPAVSPIMHPKM